MENQFPIQQLLSPQGVWISDHHKELLTKERTLDFFKHMLRIRTFDRKAISLQRQGRIGTYAPFEGQEASQVGSALALSKADWLFPTYRDHGATMTFGHSLRNILLFWNGRNEGNIPPEGMNIFPPGIPIATQIPHAAGAAFAEKRKGTNNAAIAYFGDGATSEGDFHEGLNFASIFKAPVVFFNQNNQFAISVPISKQMNTKTIAQKGLAYDIPSVRIDGNDVFAVYQYVSEALRRARSGEGPTLIEAVTWRYGAHTTADDPTKYRDQNNSLKVREEIDPLLRVERCMKINDWHDENWVRQMTEEVVQEVDQAVGEMEQFPQPDPSVIFDYVYKEPTLPLVKQKQQLLNLIGGKEHDNLD
ncbi:pyruvate dehydrogenase (acetyl-transferring) E1 component subunit alpha [Jeotgalibacillus sp. S-D1]|uniref:pyruvate dehydrogenase (acetyl-transferring) E1 component subunit alpha n=1 Tax=Jeotgalibacillus sp. S-D1 TaxID=2552189 RepID=UPI0010593D91|nr:pyruvate dehydrogenase (acetyl-transferring) E1 component subunit alpha [Jeotgalibacillus sp. S-D1]TDL35263.1 pyruvate dehydrogenase (acetyl-transferring) E1 component subunit alpha [Jeotgalibacillus sp. S-D1]